MYNSLRFLPLGMPKILALDYGAKRCGLAETDSMQIIASALTTVASHELMDYLKRYLAANDVETLVVGLPVRMSGELSGVEAEISAFIAKFVKVFPHVPVVRFNEMYSSSMALGAMIAAGAKKKQRNAKEGTIDRVAATIILQQYLEQRRNLKQ